MPNALSDSISGRANVAQPALVRSWRDGGRDAAWVHLAGALDRATVPQLEQTLEQFQLAARLVVLDLRDLEFIDNSGVRAILDASRRARQAARRLVLLRGPSNVDRMFALSGSSTKLEIGDLNPADSPIEALVQLAERDCAL